MKKFGYIFVLLALICKVLIAGDTVKLHILTIGAHPDDAEDACGTAALFVAAGHQVKLVSVTNGDAGHQTMGGGELMRRRAGEAKRSGEILGVEYQILDNHDGELLPTLENRCKIIRLIREFNSDIVICPRLNDYHPDHRNTAQLVLDAGYMVTVPNICPETPVLRKNPVFLFTSDSFTKPIPFKPDVVVGIDETIEKKIDNNFREKLIDLYGKDKGLKIKYAEAFEDSEYGTRLDKENIPSLFPFVH